MVKTEVVERVEHYGNVVDQITSGDTRLMDVVILQCKSRMRCLERYHIRYTVARCDRKELK